MEEMKVMLEGTFDPTRDEWNANLKKGARYILQLATASSYIIQDDAGVTREIKSDNFTDVKFVAIENFNKEGHLCFDLYNHTAKYIKSYLTDLIKIDFSIIIENKGIPFIHLTREHGTGMILLDTAENYPKFGETVPYLFATADREDILQGKRAQLNYRLYKDNCKVIHYYDGEALKKISADKAEDIFNTYSGDLRDLWKKEVKIVMESK